MISWRQLRLATIVVMVSILQTCTSFAFTTAPSVLLKRSSFSSTRNAYQVHRSPLLGLNMNNKVENNDDDFWKKQKELVAALTETENKSLRQEESEKYQKRVLGLVGDTAYFSFFIFCLLWLTVSNPFLAFSYALGAFCGLAYSYGLGKYVATVGGTIEEVGAGAGVGSARFAFLIVLFILVGKFKSEGLMEIPAILGFFTYQLASLNQGLREFSD